MNAAGDGLGPGLDVFLVGAAPTGRVDARAGMPDAFSRAWTPSLLHTSQILILVNWGRWEIMAE